MYFVPCFSHHNNDNNDVKSWVGFTYRLQLRLTFVGARKHRKPFRAGRESCHKNEASMTAESAASQSDAQYIHEIQ